jgi:integrase/recombinase XerD
VEKVVRARVVGPLAPHADGFRAELARMGYTHLSAEGHVFAMAHLSRWLAAEGLDAGELTQARVEQFLTVLWPGRQKVPTERTLARLLGYLRDRQVVPPWPTPTPTPLDELLARYRRWLFEDRGLAARTVVHYEHAARRFLGERSVAAGGGSGVQGLVAGDVTAFLLRECSRLAVGSAQARVNQLRSLLRFLYLEGLTATSLAGVVPPVAGWRDTRLPATLTASQVTAMLESCDRTQRAGLRDFAILMLLARLGLRAAEVAGLELGDVDWRAGEIVIRGKTRRDDRLPLLVEVGEAMAAYLADGRPRAESRTLFLTRNAPLRAMRPTAIGWVVRFACVRAGLAPVSPHRLRHGLASEMLRNGAHLREISQVLRHRDLATTAIYAKVDRATLRQVAQPWPGAE